MIHPLLGEEGWGEVVFKTCNVPGTDLAEPGVSKSARPAKAGIGGERFERLVGHFDDARRGLELSWAMKIAFYLRLGCVAMPANDQIRKKLGEMPRKSGVVLQGQGGLELANHTPSPTRFKTRLVALVVGKRRKDLPEDE